MVRTIDESGVELNKRREENGISYLIVVVSSGVRASHVLLLTGDTQRPRKGRAKAKQGKISKCDAKNKKIRNTIM